MLFFYVYQLYRCAFVTILIKRRVSPSVDANVIDWFSSYQPCGRVHWVKGLKMSVW